ncbi:MAG TPA: hypothetical protein VFU21_22760 [Kofleriaceae bacterium]|nr:hypothetical protein [Kofleriaceae bacterium]
MRVASRSCRFTLLLLLCLGCAGGGGESGDTESGADKVDRKQDKPVSEQGKRWSGWRWKGRRQDCFFLVGNECHSSLDDACKAARCKKSECVHDDSAPAKVSCDR